MKEYRYQWLITYCLLSLTPFVGLSAINPSSDQNYIITYTPNEASFDISNLDPSKSCPVVQYFDGLGRPIQTVAVGVTPELKDLVTHTEYDAAGRANKTWLPFGLSSENSGAYVKEYTALSGDFYSGSNGIPSDSVRYTLNIYDNSPLNRIVKGYGAGCNWRNAGKGVRNSWYSNNQSDSLKVNMYVIQSETSITKKGSYEDGTLYVTSQIDEDGHKTWTFTDKLGHTILTRAFNEGTYYSTYYVYNDLNQLVYVLPPLASDALTANGVSWNTSTTSINLYGYYYRYDVRGNCIEKKLPGILPQYMIYDKANRLVFTQDGNQRNNVKLGKNLWSFTEYDALGRPIIRGEIRDFSTQSLESLVSYFMDTCVVETFNGTNVSNYGYTINFFGDREKLNEIFYYDNYSFIKSSLIPGARVTCLGWKNAEALDANYVHPTDAGLSAKGLLTGNISFLSSSQSLKKYTAYYYDQKGQVVQKNSTNFARTPASTFGVERYAYSYDFKGKVLHVCHRHSVSTTTPTLIEGSKYTYDHAGRIKTTKHYINNESAAVTTSTNVYNELGQLRTKTYGNNIEVQTYSYNIRGWLKEINGNFFSEKLFYEENNGFYNGNISKSSWMRLTGKIHTLGWYANDSLWKNNWATYTYSYDNLNRLKEASGDNVGSFTEKIRYDKHGNITGLARYGITEHRWGSDGMTPNHVINLIDTLSYYNIGNRLDHIDERSHNDQLFTGGQDYKYNSTAYYYYDFNGNLSANLNKNISTLKYNSLNLADTVQFRQGHMITNAYDASGAKIQTIYNTASGSTVLMPIGSTLRSFSNNYVTTVSASRYYYDNIIYESSSLKVQIPDGIMTGTAPGNLKNNYYLKDHLGNIRVVFDDNGVIKQVNNYYPFGMEYGESAQDQNGLTYQNYLFGGKEFDRKFEINMSDFGARSYDGTLGRWTTMDPLAEKYYSISPYAYCANNPVLFIDNDGKEISVSRVVVDGRTTININVTGKVVNQSGTNYSSEQLNQYANRLSSAISEVFTGSGETVDYKCTATISVASAENPLSNTDHAYNILDEGNIPGFIGNADVVGGSRLGGKNVNISQKILDKSPATSGEFAGTGKTENGEATLERTGSHETGHTATLSHPVPGTSDKNVMHQTIQDNAGMSAAESQILQIEKAYKDENLNK